MIYRRFEILVGGKDPAPRDRADKLQRMFATAIILTHSNSRALNEGQVYFHGVSGEFWKFGYDPAGFRKNLEPSQNCFGMLSNIGCCRLQGWRFFGGKIKAC